MIEDKLLKVMECLFNLSKDGGLPFPVKFFIIGLIPTNIIVYRGGGGWVVEIGLVADSSHSFSRIRQNWLHFS
ncbi:hypothetical protein HDV62DRAFT_365439 [Trichoderma sp. SZMC 28011]